jgi:phage terminase large subunit
VECSKEDLKRIQSENGFSDEHMQQEYYCSFNRGVEGSYYGRLIEKAREEKRICNVQYEPRSPVHTAWDIGFGDSTSITFWQEVGGECRIIDFYEAQGESIAHYAKIIQQKPYVYGSHYLPHDAGSGSIQTGRTVQDVAYEIGIKTIILEREVDIQIGIEAVRSLLSIAFIDENKCKHLIKCLENYHKKYNDKTQYYSESPVHDWCSHASDSIRYMANARIQYGRGPGSLTPQKLNELKNNAGFGPKPKGNPGAGPLPPFMGR